MRGENDAPEKGSAFNDTPPRAAAPAATAGTLREPRGGRSARALIIEDNVDASDTLRVVLEFAAYVVDVAYTGPEALAKARTFRPDVVLCDIGLPGMDGYAVARAMRADPALGHVTLVALSGFAEPEDVARAKEAGFDAHVVKPPDIRALLRLLETLEGDA